MKKWMIGSFLMVLCCVVMAAPGMLEKTYTGKIQFLEKEIKGQKVSGYFISAGAKSIKLPVAKGEMDPKKYVDKEVTVVVKGTTQKVKTKKGTVNRFTAKEIVSIKEAAATKEAAAEEE